MLHWCYISAVPNLLTQTHQKTNYRSLWVICESQLSFNNWCVCDLKHLFPSRSLSSYYWPQRAVIVLTIGHIAEKKHLQGQRGKKELGVKHIFSFLAGEVAGHTILQKPVWDLGFHSLCFFYLKLKTQALNLFTTFTHLSLKLGVISTVYQHNYFWIYCIFA